MTLIQFLIRSLHRLRAVTPKKHLWGCSRNEVLNNCAVCRIKANTIVKHNLIQFNPKQTCIKDVKFGVWDRFSSCLPTTEDIQSVPQGGWVGVVCPRTGRCAIHHYVLPARPTLWTDMYRMDHTLCTEIYGPKPSVVGNSIDCSSTSDSAQTYMMEGSLWNHLSAMLLMKIAVYFRNFNLDLPVSCRFWIQLRLPLCCAPPNTHRLWEQLSGTKLQCSYRESKPSHSGMSHSWLSGGVREDKNATQSPMIWMLREHSNDSATWRMCFMRIAL